MLIKFKKNGLKRVPIPICRSLIEIRYIKIILNYTFDTKLNASH